MDWHLIGRALQEPWSLFTSPAAAVFWLYLLMNGFSVVYAYRRDRNAGIAAADGGFWAYCFPKALYADPSTRTDILYFCVNASFKVFFFAALVISFEPFGHLIRDALRSLSFLPYYHLPESVDVWVYSLVMFTAMDFGLFFSHYLQHRWPLLWEFHKVHHSATTLMPLTLYRQHLFDDWWGLFCTSFCTATVGGIYLGVIASEGNTVGLLQQNVFYGAFLLLHANLRHSHIWIQYPGVLGWLFISPAQHHIHHSVAPEHWNRNMGMVFGFWDKWFGTLYIPQQREALVLGLGGEEERHYAGVWKLYYQPWIGFFQQLKKSLPMRRRLQNTTDSL
jgi:sterol desaturase/sphingolipid hydroxylase (fatty acid hydroxylase superfamily)